MIFNKKYGDFLITVANPYPCWVTIKRDDQRKGEISFSHEELRDLEYLIKKMINEVNSMLSDKEKI